jgi:hypothetical protein
MAKKIEDYTDEDKAAIRALQQAAERLKKSVGGTQGSSVESQYASAYNKAYALGLRDYKLKTNLTTR